MQELQIDWLPVFWRPAGDVVGGKSRDRARHERETPDVRCPTTRTAHLHRASRRSGGLGSAMVREPGEPVTRDPSFFIPGRPSWPFVVPAGRVCHRRTTAPARTIRTEAYRSVFQVPGGVSRALARPAALGRGGRRRTRSVRSQTDRILFLTGPPRWRRAVHRRPLAPSAPCASPPPPRPRRSARQFAARFVWSRADAR